VIRALNRLVVAWETVNQVPSSISHWWMKVLRWFLLGTISIACHLLPRLKKKTKRLLTLQKEPALVSEEDNGTDAAPDTNYIDGKAVRHHIESVDGGILRRIWL
jgi:hypothetical protein